MKIVNSLILLFSRVKVGILRIMKNPLFLSCWDRSSLMNLKHKDQITARVMGGTFLKKILIIKVMFLCFVRICILSGIITLSPYNWRRR